MMGKNKKFVVFSGGCFSGKTTAMKTAKETFESLGIKVIMLNEVIRERSLNYHNIDKLREDANEYLEIQSDIISKKIQQEFHQYKNDEKAVVIVDRAITDSLFYLTFFTDKSKLSKTYLELLTNVYKETVSWAKFAFTYVYDILLEFSTLSEHLYDGSDRYRPKNLMSINKVECDMIKIFNESYLSSTSSKCERITFTRPFNTTKNTADFFRHIGINIIKEWENETSI